MSKSMMIELEAKLIEAEALADEYYSLNEELLDKVEELEWNYGIAIKELEERVEEYYELNEKLLTKVEEQDKVFTETFNLMQHHLMDSQQLQAKVEELTAARDAFEQMYLTAAYGSAALKEDE